MNRFIVPLDTQEKARLKVEGSGYIYVGTCKQNNNKDDDKLYITIGYEEYDDSYCVWLFNNNGRIGILSDGTYNLSLKEMLAEVSRRIEE